MALTTGKSDKKDYEKRMKRLAKLDFSTIFKNCPYCKKGYPYYIYYDSKDITYRMCDLCYTIERI